MFGVNAHSKQSIKSNKLQIICSTEKKSVFFFFFHVLVACVHIPLAWATSLGLSRFRLDLDEVGCGYLHGARQFLQTLIPLQQLFSLGLRMQSHFSSHF